jgi:FMN-dependent NADH-azoreductase
MSTVLILNTSALGAASVSSQLTKETVASLRSQDPDLRVIVRDIGATPIPHLDTESAAAIRGAEVVNEKQAAAQALSSHLIAELKVADTIIIGAPMYNFGISSTLKSWFDYVVRAGITFRYTEGGPVGLLEGKRAIVIESRGSFFSNGPTEGMDAQEPHLRTLLEFIGIKDITFVRAEKLAFGPDIRQQSIAAARAQLDQAVHEYQRAT